LLKDKQGQGNEQQAEQRKGKEPAPDEASVILLMKHVKDDLLCLE
jgi:hypothetical protein